MVVELCIYRVRVGLFGPYQMKNKGLRCLNYFELLVWLAIVLLMCGDIQPNPGPDNDVTSDFSNVMDSFRSNLSIIHYNVQSFMHKRDILYSELSEFDIIS